MAIKPKCINEISAALGREATDKELSDIESHLSSAIKKVASENRGKQVAPGELFKQAFERAKTDIVQRAVENKVIAAENITKQVQNIAHQQTYAPQARVQSLIAMLIDKAALDRSGRQSVESLNDAIGHDAWSRIPTVQSILHDDKLLSNEFIREVFGEDTGHGIAKKAAKEWNDLQEYLLGDAKQSGMKITPLDNWHMPQGLSSWKVAASDRGEVVADLLNNIDGNMYRHENGEKYTKDELTEFMTAAAETVATDGASKETKGGGFVGSSSTRGYQKERQIHYKSAEAWRYMQDKYGDRTAAQLIQGHIGRLSRDIAFTKQFGTDYRGQFRALLDAALTDAKNAQPTREEQAKIDKQAGLAKRYFDYQVSDTGHTTPEGAAWARRFDILRNAITFTTMGGSGINSMPDLAGFSMVGKLSTLPEMQLWSKTLRNFLFPHRKEDVELANRLGLGVQTILMDINTYIRDDKLLTLSKKGANFTTKYALLQRFERSKRMAVASVLHDSIGALTRNKEWSELSEGDLKLFESNGVDKMTFDIWKMAEVETGQDGHNTILMPRHIYEISDANIIKALGDKATRPKGANKAKFAEHLAKLVIDTRREAALKLSGTVGREVRLASGSPGVERKIDLNLDQARNGFMSEIQRSISFLKATPLSIIHNYWQRSGSLESPALTRARYVAISFALGAMITNLQNLFVGMDVTNPFDTDQENYYAKMAKMMIKGGGLGIYGDVLLQDYSGSHSKTTFGGLMAGPIIGMADDFNMIYSDIKRQSYEGKGDLGGDSVRLFKRHAIPNFFYTKALLDHMVFQQLQEFFSPGYNDRSQRRTEKGTGTKLWWNTGDYLPNRLPQVTD